MLDTVVMHRIVEVEDGRHTFQGDSNAWLDPEQPTEDQLVGKLALRIPQGGVWLGRATSPAARSGNPAAKPVDDRIASLGQTSRRRGRARGSGRGRTCRRRLDHPGHSCARDAPG
jgi:hypothetical protein